MLDRYSFQIAGGALFLALMGAFLAVGLPPRPSIRQHYFDDTTLHRHAASSSQSGAQSRPQTIVKPVSCERLPHVPGQSLTTAIVEFPPGAYSPSHRHPGSVTAFVLKGVVRSQMQGGASGTYKRGETWFEAPGALHLFAENASATEPAELLAIFVAPDNCGPLTIPEHQ